MGSARRFRRESLKGIRLWRIPHFEKHLVIYRPQRAGGSHSRPARGAEHRAAARALNPRVIDAKLGVAGPRWC
jgi:hypothetical protein